MWDKIDVLGRYECCVPIGGSYVYCCYDLMYYLEQGRYPENSRVVAAWSCRYTPTLTITLSLIAPAYLLAFEVSNDIRIAYARSNRC